jgi:malate synthase
VSTFAGVGGLTVTGPRGTGPTRSSPPGALELVTLLHRELDGRRLELLAARQERVRALAEGGSVGSPAETAHAREDDSWQLFLEMAVSDEYRDSLTLPADERTP